MAYTPRIHRAADDKAIVNEALARTRQLTAESWKLLREPAPDTFLGRERHPSQNAAASGRTDQATPDSNRRIGARRG